jgi:hypothetical protein
MAFFHGLNSERIGDFMKRIGDLTRCFPHFVGLFQKLSARCQVEEGISCRA